MSNKVSVAKAPGKILLSGEYSILDGLDGLAMTTDHWLSSYVTLNESNLIKIDSQIWTKPVLIPIKDLYKYTDHQDPLISCVCKSLIDKTFLGIDIRIQSDLPIEAGIGSSSALRLVVSTSIAGAFEDFTKIDKKKLINEAYEQQKSHQKKASGYDFLVQSIGGLCHFSIDFSNWPGNNIAKIPIKKDLLNSKIFPFYGSVGEPTGRKTRNHSDWLVRHDLKNKWNKYQYELKESIISYIHGEGDSKKNLFSLLDDFHNLMLQSPAYENKFIENLKQHPLYFTDFSFKLTGAGGNDAILIFSDTKTMRVLKRDLEELGLKQLEDSIGENGLQFFYERSVE